MVSESQDNLKESSKKAFNHQFFFVFFILFGLFNWEIVLALVGANESLPTRIEFIKSLHLGVLDFLKPVIATFVYLFLNLKIQSWIEKSNSKNNSERAEEKAELTPQAAVDLQAKSLFQKCSEIGLAGKNIIDEALIYSTAQENFLKKNDLSKEEIIWAREDLCQKHQDSLKKMQELMIVLAMQNQEKISDMHQRLKDERRF